MEGLNQKILIKFATRSRPQKFASCIANILNNANQPDNLLILVSIDGDDIPMQNIREGSPIIHNIHFVSGSSKNKIDAINRDVNECQYDWDILINFSDDQEFVIKGFDDIIRPSPVPDIILTKQFNFDVSIESIFFILVTILSSIFVSCGHMRFIY